MNKAVPIFATWSALMTVSVGFAMQTPDVGLGTGDAIANLTGKDGTVQFRTEGVTLWLDAGKQQDFEDGTLIATGEDSQAKVAFRDGREIVLGASSQVVLTLGKGSSDSIVTLLKGSLETTKPKIETARAVVKAPSKLIINSGNKSVTLAKAEDAVKIAKVIGTETPTIASAGGAPVTALPVTPKSSAPIINYQRLATQPTDFAALQGPKPMTVAVATPKIQATAPEETQIKTTSETSPDEAAEGPTEAQPSPDVEAKITPAVAISAPRITSPSAGARLWTTKSLASGGTITLTLAAENELPLQDVQATVEVMRGEQAARSLGISRVGDRYVAKLGANDIANAGVRDASLPSWTMSLRSRVAPKPGQERRIDGSTGSIQELRFASLADFPSGGVSVYLSNVSPRDGQGWIPQNGTVTANASAAGIHLINSAELPLLAPLLRGSPAFSVESTGERTSGGTNIVRKQRLIARVQPDSGGASQVVRQALNGDMAFKGSKDDYLGTGAEVAKTKSSTDGWQPLSEIVVYDRSIRPAKVSSNLFLRHPEAWGLLARHARAVFTKPVTIVDPPSAPALEWASDLAALGQAGAIADAGKLGSPRRLIFVQGMAAHGEPRFLPLNHRTFNQLGFIKAASGGQSAFALSLNPQIKKKLAKLDKGSTAGLVEQAMILAEADAVVLAPKGGGDWTIAAIEGGKLKKIASAAPPSRPTDGKAVHAWVLDTMGLVGKILSTRGRAAMAIVPDGYQAGRQGLVIDATGQGMGIVEIASLSGRYGAVKLITGADPTAALATGSKILWE